jgi:hypothetical protein
MSRIWIAGLIFLGAAFAADNPVTFHKDVLPILQKNCQSCHRPGQIAPMSFLTYQSTRPWAKSMKAAVVTRKMPPWFADPRFGHFANERTLKQSDIDILSQWADSEALEGDPKDAPVAVNWPAEGWEIQPDLVIEGPSFTVPANPKGNVVEWMFVTVPSGLTQDTWITSMEIRPSQPDVTHHICVYFRPHTDDVKYNTPVWADRPRDEQGIAPASAAGINGRGIPEAITKGSNGVEGCYVPGQGAQDYRVHAAAKMLRAGTDIVFQMHYTPNGREVVDHPRLGLTVAKQAPGQRYVSFGVSSPNDAKSFAIPPNAPNWESPPAVVEFTADANLVYMFPHMHVRGKDMTYTLTYPDGRKETILSVPRYDFNWQLGYYLESPIHVTKGTRLTVTAHYDNSANNKFNPDPNRTVYYGDMSWEEMMFPFFSVVVDKGVDTNKIMRVLKGAKADGA